jgi:hypothetical protein
MGQGLTPDKNGDNTFVLSPSVLVQRTGQVSNRWIYDFNMIWLVLN